MGKAGRSRAARSRASPGANNCDPGPEFSFQVGVAAAIELVVGVAHGFRARAAEHYLEVDRLEALVDVAVDHARRAGDAFPGPEADVEAPAAFVLDERGEVALEDAGVGKAYRTVDFASDEFGELRGGQRHGVGAEARKTLAEVGKREGLREVTGDLFRDRRRRARWRPQAVPERELEARQHAFG